MKKFLPLGIIVLVILAFGGGLYYSLMAPAGFGWGNLAAAIMGEDRGVITPTSGRPVPAGFREYYNPHYHISLLYPENLKVNERNEGQGAMTITFENEQALHGFQIFTLPYSRPQVTEDRFKKDLPSGVRTNLSNIEVDGAVGAAFYSKDQDLGETREIWFVYADPEKGLSQHLYEVTSLKSLDTWLGEIIKTWKFTR